MPDVRPPKPSAADVLDQLEADLDHHQHMEGAEVEVRTEYGWRDLSEYVTKIRDALAAAEGDHPEMTDRAPGYDPQNPSAAVLRMDTAENTYMNQGDGDSEERLHVILTAALDDPAVGAETRAALLGPPPPRCPDCGTLGGGHGLVHTRYGNGGGGNSPCPRTPAPTAEGDTRG